MNDLLAPFYRECSKYGISFIITANTQTTIRGKVAEYFPNKSCLRMAKDENYRDILGAKKGLVPQKCKGRGITKDENGCYEFQSALIIEEDQMNEKIKETSLELTKKYANYKIKRVPVLPDVVTLDMIESELNGLAKVPIGFDIEKKSIFSYNFEKEKINIICAGTLEETFPFIYPLSTEIASISNMNIKVVDFSKTMDTLKVGGDIVSTDLDSVINSIKNEIKEEATSNNKHVYMFVQSGANIENLSEDSKNTLKDILKNANNYVNTNFILIDEYESNKKLELEPWYMNNVNKNAGIWIGEDIGIQTTFSFKGLTPDMRKIVYSDMAFANDKNALIPIRKVVVVESEDEEL